MTVTKSIAMVWNASSRLVDITTRFEPYVEGFRSLGVNTITICPTGTEIGYGYPTRTFDCPDQLADPDYWRQLGCQAIVIITWHRMTDLLHAAKSAGLSVLAIVESDGEISPRFHPWATFRFATFLQPTLRGKLGAAKHWLQRFLFRAPSEHRELLANTAAADVLTFAGEGAAGDFRRFLHRFGAGDAAQRVAWLPYPVPDEFCEHPVRADRPRRVIAVGRWDSPQKNAPLLAGVVRRLVRDPNPTEVLIVGGGCERFAALAHEVPSVRVLGVQSRQRVLELMADSRSIVVPSRWESGPIVAYEMLALGGTVIGTPIVNMRAMTNDGRFGCVSSAHRPGPLADAVRAEMAYWDRGGRDPQAIASHWRPLVSPDGVATRILHLLGLPARNPVPADALA